MQRFGPRKYLALPVVWFGLAMIAMLWFGIWYQVKSEFEVARKSAEQELRNFSRVFEEHIIRRVRELDKALLIAQKYYLVSRETQPYQEAIGQRLPDPALLSDISFQMAAIDRDGIMRASTIGKHPPEPIDLKDREHFKIHKATRLDTPHVSKPVLGRKSGRWSVQLTRRVDGPDGAFEGVFVASMDPSLFGRFYGSINIGQQSAVIFAGLDGIVRVASGSAYLKLGDDISNTDIIREARKGSGVFSGHIDESGVERIFAVRQVYGHPLFVAVGITPEEVFSAAQNNRARYVAVGGIVSLLLLLAIGASIRHHLTIAYMAHFDDLTGLANRAHFRESLEKAIGEAARGKAFTLFLIDIDKFKFANDTYGHAFGDKLLRGIAKRLRKSARKNDLVARLGGDEFALLLKDLQKPADISARAQGLLEALSEPLLIEGQQINVTASIGCETVLTGDIPLEELLKNADLALYEAKTEGRNGYKAFVQSMADKFTEKRKLEKDLREAIGQNQLQMHYQVIRSLEDDSVCGFEALLRWDHPERGWVSPVDFIPIAEESGLIIPIGEWALRESCRQATRFAQNKRVAVNLSAVQFRDPDLVAKIASALETSGLPPERLELEITETLMMQASTHTIDKIRQIRALGVKIAMDDFGTGYSSLGYLCSFEFDKIKIDRSFIKGLDEHANYAAIIRTIVGLAKSLNVRTTAEGIETLDQLELIKSIGCTEAQGFLFSAPKPFEQLKEFMDLKPEKAVDEIALLAEANIGPSLLETHTAGPGSDQVGDRLRNLKIRLRDAG